jgi:hypothetical protein
MSSGEFSLYIWGVDGKTYWCELQYVDAETAVKKAADMSTRPAAIGGLIKKMMITDGGDCSVFEWEYGKGITHGA